MFLYIYHTRVTPQFALQHCLTSANIRLPFTCQNYKHLLVTFLIYKCILCFLLGNFSFPQLRLQHCSGCQLPPSEKLWKCGGGVRLILRRQRLNLTALVVKFKDFITLAVCVCVCVRRNHSGIVSSIVADLFILEWMFAPPVDGFSSKFLVAAHV